MKLHKSFIAKFVQASFFSCLSFSAYAQDVNSEENKPLVPSNEKEYEAAKTSITDNINKAVEDIKKKKLYTMLHLKTVSSDLIKIKIISIYLEFIISLGKRIMRFLYWLAITKLII